MYKGIPTLFQNKQDCCGCGACADVCAASAILMRPDVEGFLYPHIQAKRCVGCGRCEAVCPLKGSAESKPARLCYTAKSPNFREGSASGGMFPELARWIFARGGIAYGAAWTRDMRVAHRSAQDMAEIEGMRKSKYIQSDCRGAYRDALDALKSGRPVLFTGTPCQCEAMRRAARSAGELSTAAIICHGVPSPALWAKYMRYLERKHHGKLTSMDFRDKRNCDSAQTFVYRIGEREFSCNAKNDPLDRMFLRYLDLRPSCARCPFASVARATDITIGDAWGIKRVFPEFDDGMGVSLVVPNTDRGRAIWEEIRPRLEAREFPIEAFRQVPRGGALHLFTPPLKGKYRAITMRAWRVLPMSIYLPLMSTLHGELLGRIRRRIRRFIRRK